LTDRQHWVLDQLRNEEKLTRRTVEEQFSIGPKQAKRELSGLSNRGLIDFKRSIVSPIYEMGWPLGWPISYGGRTVQAGA